MNSINLECITFWKGIKMKLKKRRVADLLEQLEQIENEAKALEKKQIKCLSVSN